MNRIDWVVWKNRAALIIPCIGGVLAVLAGLRVLVMRDFSDSAWDFMGRCGADSLGFFLVAIIFWYKAREANEEEEEN